MKITEKLNNKHILIWGYGREGKSTENFIKKYCSVASLTIFEGKEYEITPDDYDFIIKSPGIRVDSYLENYTSQTELFLEEFSSQVIGITGTKGKSTTSTMLYEVLSACSGHDCLLVGNIGLPCLDYYGEINPETLIVYEMSCHQLNHIKYSPHTSVFLNLFEDHLDYYGTRDKYFEAKSNIFLHQSGSDCCFFGETVPLLESEGEKVIIPNDSALTFEMKLKGQHNQLNATFVYKICSERFGCDPEKIKDVIRNFKGLSHRLEYVAKVNGVEYYNDSISTIPEATIEAIKSISNTKTVMIGGMDRHINYDIIIDFIKAHGEFNYILSYASGKRIYESLADLSYCYYKENLDEAVAFAKEITPEGGACLFSPAAASYGYFKNFEDRGNTYKQYVLQD